MYFTNGQVPYKFQRNPLLKLKFLSGNQTICNFCCLLRVMTPVQLDAKPLLCNSNYILLMAMYHINFKEMHSFKLKLLRETKTLQFFTSIRGNNYCTNLIITLIFELNLYFSYGHDCINFIEIHPLKLKLLSGNQKIAIFDINQGP